MLRFFHSPAPLVLKKNVRFPQVQLKGSDAGRQNGVIPFSHIYMTSVSQLSHFVRFGAEKGQLQTLSDAMVEHILGHARCPVNLSFREEGIDQAISNSPLGELEDFKIAMINGMGRGYGDNVAGLGCLQHLHRYLSQRFKTVQIDILQRNAGIQSVIYSRYSVVNAARQLPITVSQFYRYDAYVDFSDLLGIPQFGQYPLYEFFLRGLSLHKEVTDMVEKRTRLAVDENNIAEFRQLVLDRAGQVSAASDDAGTRLVLLHPSASTPLRSIPEDILIPLLKTLLEQRDEIFVTCVPIPLGHPRLVHMTDQSEKDIHAFFDIIASCDAVITVGTVVYHVSGNLDIPTLLIPTVEADVDSAQFFPSVQSALSDTMEKYISEKHMSRQQPDLEQIRPIWQSIRAGDIAEFLQAVR